MSNCFIYKRRIYVPDTDYGGVVYHAKYLNFMDQARTEWLSDVGLPLSYFSQRAVHFIVRKAILQYLKAAMLDNIIAIHCSISRVGRSSLDFDHKICDANEQDCVFCHGTVTIVCINDRMKPVIIPEEMLTKLGVKKKDTIG